MDTRRIIGLGALGIALGVSAVFWSRPRSGHGQRDGLVATRMGAIDLPSSAGPLGLGAAIEDHRQPADDGPGVIGDDGPVSDDPRSGIYDASRVVFSKFHGYADALWAAEPTDAAWAGRRAQEMREYAKADVEAIDPNARIDIECHTASCRVRVFSKNRYLTDDMGPYPFSCMAKLAMAGDLGAEGPDGRYSEIYVVFHRRGVGEEGFHAYQERYCPPERKKWFDIAQQPPHL